MDLADLSNRVLDAIRSQDLAMSISELRPLDGGESSLTYSVSLSGFKHLQEQRAVLKVAPPGLPPTGNRDVLRQVRLMRALNRSNAVPVPDILAVREGDGLGRPPFFLMSFVEGNSFEPLGDPLAEGERWVGAKDVRVLMLDASRQLARLQSVDPSQIGLQDEPVTSLGAEVERWSALMSSVDKDLTGGWEQVRDRLLATLPSEFGPVIVHGDFRLGNMMASGGRVKSLIDFEIWSLGDPRIDLAWFLVHCDARRLPSAERELEGLPTESELIDGYRAAGGTEPTDLAWFHALAQFKGAAAVGWIVKHNRRSATPSRRVLGWDPHVPRRWLANAWAICNGSS